MTLTEESAARTGLGLAKLAWASFWAAFREMKMLFGCAAIFSLIVAALCFYIEDVATPGREPLHSVIELLLGLLQALLLAIIVAPAMIALHRFILLDRALSPTALMKRAYQKSFVLWWLGFNFLLLLIGLGAGFVEWLLPRTGIPSAIVLLTGVIFALQLILIFPAIATEIPAPSWRERIETSRNQMQGRFWLLIRAYFFLALPIAFAVLVKTPLTFLIDRNPDASQWLRFDLEILDTLVQFVLVLLTAALASWLYASARKDSESVPS